MGLGMAITPFLVIKVNLRMSNLMILIRGALRSIPVKKIGILWVKWLPEGSIMRTIRTGILHIFQNKAKIIKKSIMVI